MNIDLLYLTIRNAKLILLGERHTYVGDTALVVTLANKFLAAGKRLTFYMEHFPGTTTNAALGEALGAPIIPGDWSKERRDVRMSMQCLSFAHNSGKDELLFAFIGAAHLGSQLSKIKPYLGDRACGIRISEELLERSAPATPNTLLFVKKRAIFEACPTH